MTIKGDNDIRLFLKAHGSFSECIIEQIKLSDYGTTLEVTLTCNWAEGSQTRKAKNSGPTNMSLSFRLVQELRVSNGLNVAMLNNPESLNWGLNEVSAVQVVDEDPLFWPRPFEYRRFSHVVFLWEGERRIDVVFVSLDVDTPSK
jgi:hypothetical protein